jgi:hypothetical protein
VTSYTDEPATTVSSVVVTNTLTGKQAVVRLSLSLSLSLCDARGCPRTSCGWALAQGTDVARQSIAPLPAAVVDQLVADPLLMTTSGALRIESRTARPTPSPHAPRFGARNGPRV